MPTIHRTALVPYTPEEMYDLVNDVERYPEFIPWCERVEVLYRDKESTRARLTFAKGVVEKSFVTANRHQHGKMIDIRLVEGPFRRLEGYWRFERIGEGAAKVVLDMEFEFSNRVVAFAFGKIFTPVANRLVDSFVQRAREVYGEREV